MPRPQPGSKPDLDAAFVEPPPVIITPCDPWPRPYFLEDGLRKVTPYHFTYNTNCKERWRNRELLDIFATEFRDRPLEYYKSAILDGRVVVNGKAVAPDTLVRNGDVISHTMHRHEPPVTAEQVGIVHEDDDLIVINKPAGVPVHQAGRYNYNCVVEIMRSERGYQWSPLPCNRLDRLTSGVMFMGKHPKAAERMTNEIRDRAVKKEYVARVIGEFPEGDVVCEQPIMQISPKLGLNRARASGKHALTVFRRLAYYPPSFSSAAVDGDEGEEKRQQQEEQEKAAAEAEGKPWKSKRGYSIVRCLPLTGRTHQIRVHLQFLGHPIANDPIYCNQRVFGPQLGEGDASADGDEDIISRLSRMGKTEVAEALAYHDEMMNDYNRRKAEKMTGQLCDICDTPLYSDPGPHELGIYLHAKRYSAADGRWSYETPLPAWAFPPPGTTTIISSNVEDGNDTATATMTAAAAVAAAATDEFSPPPELLADNGEPGATTAASQPPPANDNLTRDSSASVSAIATADRMPTNGSQAVGKGSTHIAPNDSLWVMPG